VVGKSSQARHSSHFSCFLKLRITRIKLIGIRLKLLTSAECGAQKPINHDGQIKTHETWTGVENNELFIQVSAAHCD